MIDTGGTICQAAEALKAAGAAKSSSPPPRTRCFRPGGRAAEGLAIDEVVVTDTLPIPPERRFDKLTVLPIAPLLARAIHEVFEDGSVTSLFDGQRPIATGRPARNS